MLLTNTRKYFCALLICCMALISGTPAFASEDPPVNLGVIERISSEHFLSASSLMLDASPATLAYSNNSSNYSQVFLDAVSRYRIQLREMGEEYSSVRSEADVQSTALHADGTLHVVVQETTFLSIKGAGTDTGYATMHELIFQNDNGELTLLQDVFLEPSGLLPLYEAEKFVASDSEYFNVANNATMFMNEAESAETVRPTDNDVDYLTSPRAGYNYTAMANYLEQYWKSYNPNYRRFDSDCTNFVSQALRVGGWQDKPGWYGSADYWWYNSLNQSKSWTSVDYWGTFARNSGRTTMLSNVWYLRKGDVLQVTTPGTNQKIHTMMVSYFADSTPYFTYHTTDRYRRSMKQVLLDWNGASYYAYQT